MKNNHPWHAIIAFNNNRQVSEDWNWFFADIRNAAEKKSIQVYYAGPEDKQLVIGPATHPHTIIDMNPYRTHGKGYLFVSQDREIAYQPYDQSPVILEKAKKYFGISLTP